MTGSAFPQGFDPTTSILFLGAGFTRSAVNIIGEPPPTGAELATKIKSLCELPIEETSGIQDLSRYAVDQGRDLYRLLTDLYTVKNITDIHATVLSLPWLRIYTTNYDDCVEFHSIVNQHKRKDSYALFDAVPKQLRENSIVHLHGYVHNASPVRF